MSNGILSCRVALYWLSGCSCLQVKVGSAKSDSGPVLRKIGEYNAEDGEGVSGVLSRPVVAGAAGQVRPRAWIEAWIEEYLHHYYLR